MQNYRYLLETLRGLPCEIVMESFETDRVDSLPEYDIGISFMYSHKIPASEFEIPFRWVNFHPGPLPEFRGRNIAYQAIMQQAPNFGASIHYMDAEFDTGQLIEVVRFPIESHHTAGDLVQRSHEELVSLFEKHIPDVLAGKVPSTPQAKGKYYSKSPIKHDIELTAEQSRRVRAVMAQPAFTATATIGGVKYKIIRSDESE
jgi:methionyl-tRNA formyltransferase